MCIIHVADALQVNIASKINELMARKYLEFNRCNEMALKGRTDLKLDDIKDFDEIEVPEILHDETFSDRLHI